MTNRLAIAALGVALCLVLGTGYLIFGAAMGWRFEGWKWFHIVSAALGLGFLIVLVQIALHPLRRVIDRDSVDDPLAVRALRIGLVLAFGLFLLAVSIWMQEKGIQLPWARR